MMRSIIFLLYAQTYKSSMNKLMLLDNQRKTEDLLTKEKNQNQKRIRNHPHFLLLIKNYYYLFSWYYHI